MPRPRFAQLPAARRRALLDVAGRHFAARGYAGASLNAILAEAGVPKGVAYYYFDDKADLYATVAEDAFAGLAPLFPASPDWASLRRLYDANLAQLRERPWLAALGRVAPPDEIAARLQPIGEALLALADACRRAGLLRDDVPADLLFAMIGGLDGAIDQWWVAHPEAGPREAEAAFAALRQLVEPR